MRLLSATPSPFARKVRIVLQEKAIDFELVTEVPWDNDASAPSYNPLGKIPVLVLDDGTTYYDSTYILEYLEYAHPHPAILPSDPLERLVHRRFEVLADGLCDAVVLITIESTRGEAQKSARWQRRQQNKVEAALEEMDKFHQATQPFTAGETFGLADIALGCALGYLDVRLSTLDWRAKHPELSARFDALSERSSFRQTVPKVQTLRDPVV
ncbi:MAG: glutathione S-transferase N-terminal domain-containing protein [Gammaproteobacteria bacterium]|nr:glutathione S-transferase N-terminal domain-containing protein [Gammaproteobacteria bacterium]